MDWTQAEADQLLAMVKRFGEVGPLEFALTQPMDYERVLFSVDKREEFILTIERGRKRRIRLKYQTRARRVLILARLDLDGTPHRNPPNAPYRPGELMPGTHLHLYREGFADRIAFLLGEAPGWGGSISADGQQMLFDFMRFCNIVDIPPTQLAI
jgi:hypothetical protein